MQHPPKKCMYPVLLVKLVKKYGIYDISAHHQGSKTINAFYCNFDY